MVLSEPSSLGVDPATVAQRPDSVQSVYQPIVALGRRRELVGFEALARWPGAPEVDPVAVFAAARAAGSLAEMDWACRVSAVAGAMERNLGRAHTLFVNVEPEALREGFLPNAEIRSIVDRACGELRIILELTERAIADDPSSLLRTVEWARSRGFGIALDDVGTNPHSLALLPLIQPDVIKLDRTLLSPRMAEVAHLVGEHARTSGASLLAEGIETKAHLRRAMELGARYGQGRMLGAPGALPTLLPAPSEPVPLIAELGGDAPDSPGSLLDTVPCSRVDSAASIDSIDRVLDGVESARDALTVLCAVDTRSPEARRVAERVARLADRHPFVAVIGIEEDVTATDRIGSTARWTGASDGDPVNNEWALVAIGSTTEVALLSRSTSDHPEGHLDLGISYERAVVCAAGRSLSRRVETQTI